MGNISSTTTTTVPPPISVPSLQALNDTTGNGSGYSTSTNTNTGDEKSRTRLLTHISRDLPHHIFERELTPTSGRFSSTYRIRHQDSGAVMVLKVALVNLSSTNNSSGTGTSTNNQANTDMNIHTGNSISHNQGPALNAETKNVNLKNPEVEQNKSGANTYTNTHKNSNENELNQQETELQRLLQIQSQNPHLLAYQSWSISTTTRFSIQNENSTVYTPIYLLRPHLYATLSNRVVTRPFLSNAEKMFIAHQILEAVGFLHKRGFVHGHLTCDNVGVTSWNWVVLVDVLPNARENNVDRNVNNKNRENVGRPTFLAEDDPSDWIYYFQERGRGHTGHGYGYGYAQGHDDSQNTNFVENSMKEKTNPGGGTGAIGSNTNVAGNTGANPSMNSGANAGEKRCYIAPERFVTKEAMGKIPGLGGSTGTGLTPAMDIFSLGCVLMELFLNGEPAMDLGDLMEYKQTANGIISEHSSLPQRLNKIESGNMRAACRHMLHLDPAKRLSAEEYLRRLTTMDMEAQAATDDTIHTAAGDENDERKEASAGVNAKQIRNQALPLPSCHASVFLPLFTRVRREVLSPDARIALAAIQYGKVIRETVGFDDVAGEEFFRRIIGPTTTRLYDDDIENGDGNASDKKQDVIVEENIGNNGTDEKRDNEHATHDLSKGLNVLDAFDCDALLAETEKLLRDIEDKFNSTDVDGIHNEKKEEKDEFSDQRELLENRNMISPTSFRDLSQTPSSAALVIFVQFVLSTIRHTQRPSSRLVGMQLLLQVAIFSTDEVRLQRIVPTIISILNDTDASVRSMAIHVLTAVLSMIEVFPPSDAQVFPQYILKRISYLLNDPVFMVRLAFVECMAQLAETALRFLDTRHAILIYETVDVDGGFSDDDLSSSKAMEDAMKSAETVFGDDAAKLLGDPKKSDGSAMSHQQKASKVRGEEKDGGKLSGFTSLICDEYDKDLSDLQENFARWVVSVTTDVSDHDSALKQAILKDIARLCQFFGNEGVMTCILPQILAFLNHRKDWQLRATLCQHLPAVCAIVGRAATEQFVVPCVETALIDDEDAVVSSALCCLASLGQMGLLNRVILLGSNTGCGDENQRASKKSRQGILEKYSALLVHPSDNIRYSASFLFATCYKTIGFPDDEVHILPILRPFLRYDVERTRLLNGEGIMSALLPPLQESDFTRNVDLQQFVSVGEHQMDEHLVQSYSDSVRRYVGMRRKSQKGKEEIQNRGNFRILQKDTIKEQQKATFSVYLPNQKYAEVLPKVYKPIPEWHEPIPEWYEQLRQIAQEGTSFESEHSALRTMSILSKVYALKISQKPHSSQPKKIWEGDFLTHDLGFEKSFSTAKGVNGEHLKDFLNDRESQIFNGALKGEWGSIGLMDPGSVEICQIVSTLRSVEAPVFPPRLGPLRDKDGKRYSCHVPVRPPTRQTSETTRRALPNVETTRRPPEWKPKVDALSCSSTPHEHNGPVTRIAISHDQTFFVSASHDGTCKVFETRQITESSGDLRSCLIIGNDQDDKPSARVNDITMVENSHSVASGNSDGSIQVWRVDLTSIGPANSVAAIKNSTVASKDPTSSSRFSRVTGCKMLRKVEAHEGEISSVSHFNTNSASIVTFASQMSVHSWDLRCAEEPFALPSRPELGYLTSMTVGTDRNWLMTGTNSGFLSLWDIRFQKCVKVWQHSSYAPINRLGASFAALSKDYPAAPHVVVGSGLNETSIFDITSGTCRQCFRVLDPSLSYVDRANLPAQCASLPTLNDVQLSSDLSRKRTGINLAMESILSRRTAPPHPSIQSFNGRVGSSGLNYLVTGGTDGFLRYWNFAKSSECFTISGLRNSQPRPAYESIDWGSGKMILCRQLPTPTESEIAPTNLPKMNHRGAVRPANRHRDAILDIKRLDDPMKGLITCSRDGMIKIWR